jgi:hypothetical protein
MGPVHRQATHATEDGPNMDGTRFETLARSLAGKSSRRGFLGTVGCIAALVSGLAGVTPAGAACPPGQVLGARGRCLCRRTGRPAVGGVCGCAGEGEAVTSSYPACCPGLMVGTGGVCFDPADPDGHCVEEGGSCLGDNICCPHLECCTGFQPQCLPPGSC